MPAATGGRKVGRRKAEDAVTAPRNGKSERKRVGERGLARGGGKGARRAKRGRPREIKREEIPVD